MKPIVKSVSETFIAGGRVGVIVLEVPFEAAADLIASYDTSELSDAALASVLAARSHVEPPAAPAAKVEP